MLLQVLVEWAVVDVAGAEHLPARICLRKEVGESGCFGGAMAGHLPALGVSVPVVNLVLMVELFWGPFSAKTLSVYSVAGSRLVSTYSTVFPDTVRVISGTEHEIHKPRQLPLLVGAISRLGQRHTPSF